MVLVLLVAWAPLAAVEGSAAPESPVEVRIEQVGPISVPMGVPFRWRATLPSAPEAPVTLELVPPGGSPRVPIAILDATEAAGEVVTSRWFPDTGRYRIEARDLAGVLTFEVTGAEHPVPRFRDVTAEVGIEPVVDGIADVCDNFTAGASWGDVTGNGYPDLYIPYQTERARLYVNEEGRFVERAVELGVANEDGIGMGAVFVDYDNDGHLDLYVVNMGANRLYRNDGTGRFTDVAPEAGVADPGPGSAAAWADFDGDGHLDLYVANYGECSDRVYGIAEPAPDRLYRNNGDGTFTDTGDLLDEATRTRFGFQAGWADLTGDGRLDLYVANDDRNATGAANVLWRNDGPDPEGRWRFTDVSRASGSGVDVFSMGLAIGDYDRDGQLDLAVSNIGPTCLLRNDGDGTFTERGAEARVARPLHEPDAAVITWGLVFADLTNSGWEDLYVAAGTGLDEAEETDAPPPQQEEPAPLSGDYGPGRCELPERQADRGLGMLEMIAPRPGNQPNAVFVNAGDGSFLDVSAATGADDLGKTRGVAVADVDRDGRLDILVVNQAGPARLYRNETRDAGAAIQVELVGSGARDACGARLELRLDDATRLVRQVDCGSTGLGSGQERTLHVGLGDHDGEVGGEIRWPSGDRQDVNGLLPDHRYRITESGEVEMLAAVTRPAEGWNRPGGLGALGAVAVSVLVLLGIAVRRRPDETETGTRTSSGASPH